MAESKGRKPDTTTEKTATPQFNDEVVAKTDKPDHHAASLSFASSLAAVRARPHFAIAGCPPRT